MFKSQLKESKGIIDYILYIYQEAGLYEGSVQCLLCSQIGARYFEGEVSIYYFFDHEHHSPVLSLSH